MKYVTLITNEFQIHLKLCHDAMCNTGNICIDIHLPVRLDLFCPPCPSVCVMGAEQTMAWIQRQV